MKRRLIALLPALLLGLTSPVMAQHHDHHAGHDMTVDTGGTVMNENHDTLPRGCDAVSRDYDFTVHAGSDHASGAPGMIFGMDQHQWRVQGCSRLTVTFINEDQVRHQWMVHGLPNYLYPAGMFHIEANGGHQKSGTFIVPAEDQTYLVHCDMAQHMEKGMRGQLVVGKGSGDLWGVAGISDQFLRFSYLPGWVPLLAGLALLLGFAATLLISSTRSGAGKS